MCSHHPSFTRQHHLLTCTFAKEQILSQQASQLLISIASRSLFMFLNICSGSTCSSVTLAHRSANTTAPCDFPALVTRAPIINHFTSDTRPRPPLHTEPRAKDPLPLQEDHYNVITITIIINYNYFCPPEALHRPHTPCLRSSAAAALPRGPRPPSSFNKMLSESNIVILLIECNL